MATKKTSKALPAMKTAPDKTEQVYKMPVEVSNWIENATSRIQHLTSTVERQKEEIRALKVANRSMEARVMGKSFE